MLNTPNESINSIYFKNKFTNKDEFETQKKEKLLLAKIINCLVQTNNLVEFNGNVRFYDSKQKILTPTIAQEYADDGKKAMLITPNFHETFKKNNLSIVKCNFNNPFGEYQDLITSYMIKKINEAGCFVASNNMPGLSKRFKAWSGMGIPCVYTTTEIIDQKAMQMDTFSMKKNEDVKMFIDSLTKGNNLTLEENNVQLGEKIHKIYVLKR